MLKETIKIRETKIDKQPAKTMACVNACFDLQAVMQTPCGKFFFFNIMSPNCPPKILPFLFWVLHKDTLTFDTRKKKTEEQRKLKLVYFSFYNYLSKMFLLICIVTSVANRIKINL